MPEPAQLKEWRANRRKSLAALPAQAAVFGLAALAAWAAYAWLHLPGWLAVTAALLSGVGLLGDLINVVYLGRKIAAAERHRA